MENSHPPWAVVTGANRGLGLEICRQLAQRGTEVLLTSRDPDRGQSAADDLRAQGLAVHDHPLDVADPASVTALVATVQQSGRRIDALINNAGIALDGFNADIARLTLAVNCFGALKVTDELLPFLAAHGRVVMVSSGMGQLEGLADALAARFLDPALTRASLTELLKGFVEDVAADRHLERGWPANAYRVSKIGLNAFTRLLAQEQADSTIRINAISPGWVRTAMGGPNAPRTVEEGASGLVWAALLEPGGPTGGFFRDGHPLAW